MNTQVLSDRVLLNNYLSGDRGAISKLIDRHTNRVRDYIRMMVKDNDVADDILQETFIKAVRVIDDGRYADNGKFLSWILRIAHNQVIDHFRARKSDKTVSESDAGYNMLGTLRFAERTVEDRMISEQIEADVRRPPPRRATRSGDDAILFGAELSGDSRPNRGEHQYGAGQNALRSDKPPKDD